MGTFTALTSSIVAATTIPHAALVELMAVAAAASGVGAACLGVLATRRLKGVASVAERLATGEFGATVARPGTGFVGRLEQSINQASARLAETLDAASTDRLTQANLRVSDVVGRYGGEEFMLVLPETTPEEATDVAEKTRIMVERHRFMGANGAPFRVTISIGIAGGHGATLQVDPFIQSADQAMYSAKSLGRNQTYVFREPDDDARVVGAPISSAGRARALEVGAVGRRAAEAALSAIVTPFSHYRGKPSSLIATIAVELARDLSLPPQEVERIRVASLLHDIGKIAVPGDILEKPAPLTEAEWSFVRQHPRIGQLIIDEAGGLRDAGKIILHHHERFGGHGYPHGLRGKAIPLGSRIVAIADAYDAMVHDGPYKRAMDHQAALVELRRHSVTQFDPDLVNLFVRRFADLAPVPDLTLVSMVGADAILDIGSRRQETA